jgi:hypothetical protein
MKHIVHRAHGDGDAINIYQRLQRDIGAQRLENNSLRLERVQKSGTTQMLRERHGDGADIGAYVCDDASRRAELTQKLNFTLTILAVQFERSPDDLIVAVIDEWSVPRLRDGVERRGSLLAGSPRF